VFSVTQFPWQILYSLWLNSAELRAEPMEGFRMMTVEKLFKVALVFAGQS